MQPMLADVGIPMICIQLPAMLYALVPVIILEALLIHRWLPISYLAAFRESAGANLLTTIIGVPLAWLVMFLLEIVIMYPLAMITEHFHWNGSPILEVFLFPFTAAWIGPVDRNYFFVIPIASVLMLIPSFYVSIWIERWAYKKILNELNLDAEQLRRAVFKANLASYAALFLIACGWLIYFLVR